MPLLVLPLYCSVLREFIQAPDKNLSIYLSIYLYFVLFFQEGKKLIESISIVTDACRGEWTTQSALSRDFPLSTFIRHSFYSMARYTRLSDYKIRTIRSDVYCTRNERMNEPSDAATPGEQQPVWSAIARAIFRRSATARQRETRRYRTTLF